MSRSLMWEPHQINAKSLEGKPVSELIKILQRIFNSGYENETWILDITSVPKLEVAVSLTPGSNGDILYKLIKFIKEHGSVRIWVEY